MAKKPTRKATKKKAPAKKARSTAKKKSAAKKKTTPKKTASKASRKKTTKAAAKKKSTRSAAKQQTASKKTTKATKTTRSTARKSTRKAPPAPVAPPPAPEPKAKPARAPRPLAPKDLEEFRLILLQKRAEIVGDMSTLESETRAANRQDAAGDLSSMPIHMADLGSDNYELEFTLGLIEGERAILKEIDEALERIKDKTYGYCLATGNPIGKARLRAKPWAKYCYEYTLAQERQGREL